MDLSTLTQPPTLYILIAVAVAIVALIAWAAVSSARRRREREALRERYGAEYDRTVAEHNSTRAAVADLKEREQRHEQLELHDLNDADRDLVRRHMAAAQFSFVEDPSETILSAQRVVSETLKAKGYPVDRDRDEGLRLFSVDHPDHAGAVRTLLEGRHDGDTEHMRRMFLNSRKVLTDITGANFVMEDAHPTAGDDLRVERSPDAETTAR